MGPVNYFAQFIEFSTIVSVIHTCIIMHYTLQAIMLNYFVLLTFDKTVILEVSRTGTINLAL